jgi:hypothetical protein
VISNGWLTTLSRYARKTGATLALALAVASIPWAAPSAPIRAASVGVQSTSTPLGVVVTARAGGQLVAENRDHEVRPTPKNAPDFGGPLTNVDLPATHAPTRDSATVATEPRDRRSTHLLPDHTGPPLG